MRSKFDVTRYELYFKNLPEGMDGYKIAHISDLHSRPTAGAEEIIARERPDMIAVTGDILHDDDKSAAGAIELIKKLAALAPTYFVSGNHDVWRWGHKKLFAEATGAVFSDGKCAKIEKNGAEAAVFGVGDPFSKLPRIVSENVKKSFSDLPTYNGFKILLFHRANLFDEIKDYDFDLILSGHMHGGQIRLPRVGGVLAPSSSALSGKRMLFPKYSCGRVEYDGKTMIINRGLCNTLPVPRWGNKPEIGIIVLKRDTKI